MRRNLHSRLDRLEASRPVRPIGPEERSRRFIVGTAATILEVFPRWRAGEDVGVWGRHMELALQRMVKLFGSGDPRSSDLDALFAGIRPELERVVVTGKVHELRGWRPVDLMESPLPILEVRPNPPPYLVQPTAEQRLSRLAEVEERARRCGFRDEQAQLQFMNRKLAEGGVAPEPDVWSAWGRLRAVGLARMGKDPGTTIG